MIITEISDDGNGHKVEGSIHTHDSSSPFKRTFFWNVLPEQPLTISLPHRGYNNICLCLATLNVKADDISPEISDLLIKQQGDSPDLRPMRRKRTPLNIEIQGPQSVVFSAKGPRVINLVGYFYGLDMSPASVHAPPMTNDGGISIRREESSSSNLPINDVQEISERSSVRRRLDNVVQPGHQQIGSNLEGRIDSGERFALRNDESLSRILRSLLHRLGTPDPVDEEVRKGSVNILLQANVTDQVSNKSLISLEERREVQINQGYRAVIQEVNQQGSSVRRMLDYAVQTTRNRIDSGGGFGIRNAESLSRILRSLLHRLGTPDLVDEVIKKGSIIIILQASVADHDSKKTLNRLKEKREVKINQGHRAVVQKVNEQGGSVRRMLDYVVQTTRTQQADGNEKESVEQKKRKREDTHPQIADGVDENTDEGSMNHGYPQNPVLDPEEAKRLKKWLKNKQRRMKQKEKRIAKDVDLNRTPAVAAGTSRQ